jgi:hypothetical protein
MALKAWPATRKRPHARSPVGAGQPAFRLQGRPDPQRPPNPVSTVLKIVADFILKINLFLCLIAILFNSYFKEKGLSSILFVFLGRKGPRIHRAYQIFLESILFLDRFSVIDLRPPIFLS